MQRIREIIFESEGVIDNVKNVADFQYMRTLRFNMKIINAWPRGEKQSLLINYANFVLYVYCVVATILYVVLHIDNLSFFELGHMFIIIFMTCVTWTRIILTISPKYRYVFTIFLNKMHLLHYKDVSEYAMQIFRKIHFISHIFTLYLVVIMYAALSLFNIIPMWNNYSSGMYGKNVENRTYEHTLYLSTPIDISTNFKGYLFGCICNWFLSYLCSTSFCMLDLFLSIMIFNVWGHLKILLHDLESFPLPANEVIVSMDDRYASVSAEMYSEDELKLISQKLKQCVNYHRLIANFTDQISDAFGAMLLIYYMFHQVSGCVLLLECSQMTAEALMRYLPLSIILFQQLIQMSVIFELVGSTSEKLKDAVYGVPWQYMDKNNRMIVSIFLYNVQEPIHVKALGVVPVGVTTMATILKTSLSYFAFLRNM